MDQELAFASAIEQARLIRERHISPTELTDLYLGRIDRLNPQLGTYLTVAEDHARAAAAAAEATLDSSDLPPFHGVPISIKDLNETAGIRTTWGAAAWTDRVPDFDDEVVARIKSGGFVILGKTVTPEFGPINVSEPPGYPPGRNPWDPDFSCGGSSGGAAAGIVAGLCPVSQGSDGGGSIRNPASWCGVFGLKPSRGRISDKPKPQQFFSVQGPLSRYVMDAAALLDVMAGPDRGDPFWAPPPATSFVEEASRPVEKLRVGFTTTPVNREIPVAPANTRSAAEAAALLDELGHEVVEVDYPGGSTDILGPSAVMFAAEWAARIPWMPPLETITPWMAGLIQMGRGIGAADYISAHTALIQWSREVVAAFENYDVLLTPTVALPPPRVGQYADIDMSRVAELWALTPFTATFNTTGQPAVSIPWGLDEQGLPVGVQIAGPPVAEGLLLRLSRQIEEARPWAHLRPPLS